MLNYVAIFSFLFFFFADLNNTQLLRLVANLGNSEVLYTPPSYSGILQLLSIFKLKLKLNFC